MVLGEREALDCFASNFDHKHLYSKGKDGYGKEEEVVKEALEHVHLSIFYLSCVDLVEQLHEHEDLEYICEVKKLLGLRGESVGEVDITWEHSVG